MIQPLRHWLRTQTTWVQFQELNREGWVQAARRRRIQNLILQTRPLMTRSPAAAGNPLEVRILTWRRDWKNALWALKSFYHYSKTELPLYIHDGGLEDSQKQELLRHFPKATLVGRSEADAEVSRKLLDLGYFRSEAYRRTNIASCKVFDFFLLSRATEVISIDSDIVFFRSPDELFEARGKQSVTNLYNRDLQYAYSMSLEELEAAFHVRPPERINSGLSRVLRSSIDFSFIESCLKNDKLYSDRWVTEQTLHALCSARHGVELLPDTYRVDTQAGLSDRLICKHYPGFFRELLYSEGMCHLARKTSFLKELGT